MGTAEYYWFRTGTVHVVRMSSDYLIILRPIVTECYCFTVLASRILYPLQDARFSVRFDVIDRTEKSILAVYKNLLYFRRLRIWKRHRTFGTWRTWSW